MSEWITDRLPTEADGNEEGNVYCGGNMLGKWHTIMSDEYWCPLPRLPKTREQLVDELLDVIDRDFDMGKFATWKLKVLKAREALR